MKRRSVNQIQLWFDEFIEEKSFINLSEASLKDYREAFNRYVRETQGDLSKGSLIKWVKLFKSKSAQRSINDRILIGIPFIIKQCQKGVIRKSPL